MVNTKEKLISIVIPVYNVKYQLECMIESVLNQTYKRFELILVDDGSTDGSDAVCDNWSEKDKRIKCLHQQNLGVSAARNLGFMESRGNYIIFLDGDDEIDLSMCEKMINSIEEDNSDVGCCGFFNIFQERIEKQTLNNKILAGEEIINALVTNNSFFTAVWNKLFKREILLDKKGIFIPFEQGIYVGEDGLWLSKVLKNAKKVSCISEPLYKWKRRMNSATQGGVLISIDERYLTILKAYKGMTLEMENIILKRMMCKKYLGILRDCLIQAYINGELSLATTLKEHIKEDKKIYDKKDLFILKLYTCLFLVNIKAPILFIIKVQKISKG